MKEKMKQALRHVRENAPLVQCITNFVTVNDCANIILAAGGSPTMAMDAREVEEAVRDVSALVCNMGAIESVDAMILAGKEANKLHIPVILDPVAAGGTQLRRDASRELLEKVQFSDFLLSLHPSYSHLRRCQWSAALPDSVFRKHYLG